MSDQQRRMVEGALAVLRAPGGADGAPGAGAGVGADGGGTRGVFQAAVPPACAWVVLRLRGLSAASGRRCGACSSSRPLQGLHRQGSLAHAAARACAALWHRQCGRLRRRARRGRGGHRGAPGRAGLCGRGHGGRAGGRAGRRGRRCAGGLLELALHARARGRPAARVRARCGTAQRTRRAAATLLQRMCGPAGRPRAATGPPYFPDPASPPAARRSRSGRLVVRRRGGQAGGRAAQQPAGAARSAGRGQAERRGGAGRIRVPAGGRGQGARGLRLGRRRSARAPVLRPRRRRRRRRRVAQGEARPARVRTLCCASAGHAGGHACEGTPLLLGEQRRGSACAHSTRAAQARPGPLARRARRLGPSGRRSA